MSLPIRKLASKCRPAGRRLLAGIAAALLLPWATASAAPVSRYDCHNLIRVAGQPVIEGKSGFFFRTTPDLTEYFPLSEGTVSLVKILADALAARGTSLVYVPVPTKGIVSGPFLPDDNSVRIYDQPLARHSYEMFVDRMRKAGITVVDIASAIDVKPGESPTFLGADHHWTSDGAQRAARAVADVIVDLPVYAGMSKAVYESKPTQRAAIASSMRRSIQAACRSPLPPNDTLAYETTASETAESGPAVDLFGGGAASDSITLVGTSFSDVEEFNFGGFISEFSGLDTTNFAVSGGNQLVSILSYLTSQAFADRPPKIIVWENPIYNNLGEFGEAPLLELIGAASSACQLDKAESLAIKDGDDGSAEIPLTKKATSDGSLYFVAIDAHDSGVTELTAEFPGAAGAPETLVINRPPRFKANGRFFLPIPGQAGLPSSITIKTNTNKLTGANANLCRLPLSEG